MPNKVASFFKLIEIYNVFNKIWVDDKFLIRLQSNRDLFSIISENIANFLIENIAMNLN